MSIIGMPSVLLFCTLCRKTYLCRVGYYPLSFFMATFKQQIFLAASPEFFPTVGFSMACQLAKAYDKNICFLGIRFSKKQDLSQYESVFTQWANEHQHECEGMEIHSHVMAQDEDFTEFLESSEASMLVFQIGGHADYAKPINMLKICRDLRIPYFFVREGQQVSFDRVLVPVGFLMEEREKGPFSSSFGRFFKSEIMLMLAKDYGSKAKQNYDAIRTLLEKSETKYQELAANKDSFKVELEAADLAVSLNATLLMVSASRDYGLDDIIFGPKEEKVIQKSPIPVMVINPRGDLYALCG